MTIPFRKGFNPEDYERDHEQPKPPAPHIALQKRWKQSRVPKYAQAVRRDLERERDIGIEYDSLPRL